MNNYNSLIDERHYFIKSGIEELSFMGDYFLRLSIDNISLNNDLNVDLALRIEKEHTQLIPQRYHWDCGVCCVAMVLGCSWEEARLLLPEPHIGGYFPDDLFLHVRTLLNCTVIIGNVNMFRNKNRIICHVSDSENKMPYHYIWMVDGKIFCPANHFQRPNQIKMWGKALIVERG